VGQRSRRADFTEEALGHPRVGLAVWTDSFEGRDALQKTVASPEDLPHAPAAQGFQEDVGADHEPHAQPLAQETCLVGGKPLALLQLLKELFNRRKLPSNAVEVPELPGREEIMSLKRLNQSFERVHASTSNG
jgi:hypothetical protein